VASGRFPRWAVLRPVVGIVLSLVLVGLVVGRATGLIGDASGGPAGTLELSDPPSVTETASPSSPAPTTEPSTEPSTDPSASPSATGKDDREGRDRRDRDRKRDRKRDRDGTSWTDGSAQDPELLSRVEELLEAGQALPPARFRVSSLNVLGAGHTGPNGNKPSWASGTTRIGWLAQLLRQLDVDVVGLQEYEPVQHHAFVRRTGARYGIYPGMALGRKAVRNSIAWDRATWDVVETHTVPIPYFRGNRVPMPYVLLEHRESARRVWFINIHNPASNRKRGDNQRWRNVATSLEIALMRRLHSGTGHPVILMGDFNEREEAFCSVTRRAPAVAANGGSAGPPCAPPATVGIDWIFGTDDFTFSGYRKLRGGLLARATDHPMIVADAELSEAPSS
jgi:endonuclease/exonuclease/phosphatase family metal-dependent hydrolase